MQLDERKEKILYAIIRNYQETGEPVGSRTISKYSDLNLSSATIRNEMADLEEMGLIVQPHTSAGRIPTDKGYRIYVDKMMSEKHFVPAETNNFILQKVDRMELMLKQMAKLLAVNTNYATMISAPRYGKVKLKFIQLSQMEGHRLLTVIVAEGNFIKNTMIDIDVELSNDEVLSLNLLLNTNLNGLTVDEISLGIISKIKSQAGEHADIVEKVLDAIAEAICKDEELQVYTSGATNIFKYPELSDESRASMIINAFEEKQQLTNLLADNSMDEEKQGIQVYIGEETPIQSMKDCSVVTATYELSDGLKGTIGIIGPKRMDYEKVVGTLNKLKENLGDMFSKEDN